ncbi:MAG: GNAT family N-acetyltransferase [Gemmatimonadales bacterium]
MGRIAAVHNRTHNDVHEDRVGFFGFFECQDDQAAADALFAAAAAWLRDRGGSPGLDTMRGPASPSMNDESGLLVDGFDTPPTVMMPHNPPYYVRLVERAGFRKAKDLLAYQSIRLELPERLRRAVQLLTQRKGITLRPLRMKEFGAEVERIKALYNAAWEKNWGFVPLTGAEIDHLAKQLKPVVVPELVVFAERAGQIIGFAVALPDFNVALKVNRSGRLFPGILKILWASRKISRIRILLLGVLPEYRKTGADALMYEWIWRVGNSKGYFWGEAGWILEDNTAMRNALEHIGFAAYKTYRMYDRVL